MRRPFQTDYDCREDYEDALARYERWVEAKEEREIDLYEDRKSGRYDD